MTNIPHNFAYAVLVQRQANFDGLDIRHPLGGDCQIPDPCRGFAGTLWVPLRAGLIYQYLLDAVLVHRQANFDGLEQYCKMSQNEQKAIRGGGKWDRKSISIK